MTTAEMAAATLDKCDEVLAELHEMCCEPNRSPRMEALQESLTAVRAGLEALPTNEESIVGTLKEVGAELGRLQIECCAPARMPLYADLLAGLSRTQRMLTTSDHEMDH